MSFNWFAPFAILSLGSAKYENKYEFIIDKINQTDLFVISTNRTHDANSYLSFMLIYR